MTPIADQDLSRFRCILMDEEERVIDALAMLSSEADPQDWWYLVVALDSGGYAACHFADLVAPLHRQGAALLQRPLCDLVGSMLIPVTAVVQQDSVTLDEAASRLTVVLRGEEFRGIIAPAMRGMFESQLLQMAGSLSPIPDRGVVVRQRLQRRQRRTAQTGAGPSGTPDKDQLNE